MIHYYRTEHVHDKNGEFPDGTVVDVKYMPECWLKVLPDTPELPYFVPAQRMEEIP